MLLQVGDWDKVGRCPGWKEQHNGKEGAKEGAQSSSHSLTH